MNLDPLSRTPTLGRRQPPPTPLPFPGSRAGNVFRAARLPSHEGLGIVLSAVDSAPHAPTHTGRQRWKLLTDASVSVPNASTVGVVHEWALGGTEAHWNSTIGMDGVTKRDFRLRASGRVPWTPAEGFKDIASRLPRWDTSLRVDLQRAHVAPIGMPFHELVASTMLRWDVGLHSPAHWRSIAKRREPRHLGLFRRPLSVSLMASVAERSVGLSCRLASNPRRTVYCAATVRVDRPVAGPKAVKEKAEQRCVWTTVQDLWQPQATSVKHHKPLKFSCDLHAMHLHRGKTKKESTLKPTKKDSWPRSTVAHQFRETTGTISFSSHKVGWSVSLGSNPDGQSVGAVRVGCHWLTVRRSNPTLATLFRPSDWTASVAALVQPAQSMSVAAVMDMARPSASIMGRLSLSQAMAVAAAQREKPQWDVTASLGARAKEEGMPSWVARVTLNRRG